MAFSLAFFALRFAHALVEESVVVVGVFFVWRHAYDAAPLGSGFLVKQQPRRRCNG